jgi:hypothetical protein
MPDDGGPAFSGFEYTDTKFTVMDPDGTTREESAGYKSMQYVTGNLTVRDHFAAAALAHIPALLDASEKNKSKENIAGWAYEVADAMLRERERKPE